EEGNRAAPQTGQIRAIVDRRDQAAARFPAFAHHQLFRRARQSPNGFQTPSSTGDDERRAAIPFPAQPEWFWSCPMARRRQLELFSRNRQEVALPTWGKGREDSRPGKRRCWPCLRQNAASRLRLTPKNGQRVILQNPW